MADTNVKTGGVRRPAHGRQRSFGSWFRVGSRCFKGRRRTPAMNFPRWSLHLCCDSVFVHRVFLCERAGRCVWSAFTVGGSRCSVFRKRHYPGSVAFVPPDGRRQPEGCAGRSPPVAGSQCFRARLRGRSRRRPSHRIPHPIESLCPSGKRADGFGRPQRDDSCFELR